MTFTICGKRWTFSFGYMPSDRGSCDPPDKPGKAIKVCTTLRDREQLEVILHELLHAAAWSLDEEFVETCAADMAAALWKIGYRKCA